MTCAKMMAATATATLTAGMRRPRAAGRIDAGMMRCFLQTLAYGLATSLWSRGVCGQCFHASRQALWRRSGKGVKTGTLT